MFDSPSYKGFFCVCLSGGCCFFLFRAFLFACYFLKLLCYFIVNSLFVLIVQSFLKWSLSSTTIVFFVLMSDIFVYNMMVVCIKYTKTLVVLFCDEFWLNNVLSFCIYKKLIVVYPGFRDGIFNCFELLILMKRVKVY